MSELSVSTPLPTHNKKLSTFAPNAKQYSSNAVIPRKRGKHSDRFLGETQELILKYLRDHKITQFTIKGLWNELKRAGIDITYNAVKKSVQKLAKRKKLVKVKRGLYRVNGDVQQHLYYRILLPKKKREKKTEPRPNSQTTTLPLTTAKYIIAFDNVRGYKDGVYHDWIAKKKGNKRLTLDEVLERFDIVSYAEPSVEIILSPQEVEELKKHLKGHLKTYYSDVEGALIRELHPQKGLVKSLCGKKETLRKGLDKLVDILLDNYVYESLGQVKMLLPLLKDRPLARTAYLRQLADILKMYLTPEEKRWFIPSLQN